MIQSHAKAKQAVVRRSCCMHGLPCHCTGPWHAHCCTATACPRYVSLQRLILHGAWPLAVSASLPILLRSPPATLRARSVATKESAAQYVLLIKRAVTQQPACASRFPRSVAQSPSSTFFYLYQPTWFFLNSSLSSMGKCTQETQPKTARCHFPFAYVIEASTYLLH